MKPVMRKFNQSRILRGAIKLALGSSVLTLVACDSEDSKDSEIVPSSGITAYIEIYKENSDHIFAQAQIKEFGDKDVSIILTEGDQLWFSAGYTIDEVSSGDDLFAGLVDLGGSHELMDSRREFGGSDAVFDSLIEYGDRWYTASLEKADAKLYRVSFLRDKYAEAPDSAVGMPNDFTVSGIDPTRHYSRSMDEISVSWDSGSDEMKVLNHARIHISCANPNISDFGEVASKTFEYDLGMGVQSLVVAMGDLNDETLVGECSGTVSIRRSRIGSLDNAYAGGYIRGSQLRSLSFSSTD